MFGTRQLAGRLVTATLLDALFDDATRIGKWVHAEPIDLLVVVSEHAVA